MSWKGFTPGEGGKPKIAFGKITLSSKQPAAEPEEEDEGGGGGFGSFGTIGAPFKPPPPTGAPTGPEKTLEELEMEKTMGFSGFGTVRKLPEKVAKTFDVKEMVEAIKKANKRKNSDPTAPPTTDAVIQPLAPEEKKTDQVKEQVKEVRQSKLA